jgi:hypothetical protein
MTAIARELLAKSIWRAAYDKDGRKFTTRVRDKKHPAIWLNPHRSYGLFQLLYVNRRMYVPLLKISDEALVAVGKLYGVSIGRPYVI